jgi:hypothetical protein
MTERFTKTVTIKTVDEDERTATGAVLVPNELDHEFDFFRPDAVERFYSDDVDTGVLHAAFPDDAAELERSEIIDAAEEIGDEEFPPGTWVATRSYEDDDLWSLVEDGVLQGFSIGGDITAADEHDDLPDDVRVPDAVDHDGAGGTELINGTVDEVSDVDIPAVPRATYKGDGEDLGKSLLEEVDGEDEFVELMTEQRGHDEADARRLYQYLTEHAKSEKGGDGTPGDTVAECVAIIMDERGVSESEAREICDALQEANITMSNSTTESAQSTDQPDAADDDHPDDATKWRRFKAWLTGADDGEDSPEDQSRKANTDDPEQSDSNDDADDANNHAAGGDTPASTMTDDDTDKSADAPEWAETLTEKVEQIENRIDEIESEGEDAEKSTEDDETDADAGAEKAEDEPPEWAEALTEKVDDLDERVDAISQQSGHSQQLDGAAKNGDGDEEVDEVEQYKKALIPTGGNA